MTLSNERGNDMRNYYGQLKIGPNPGNESARALVASGIWLRASIIGAIAVVSGLALLFGGEGNPVLALALAFGGGALAPIAWRRSWALVDRAEKSVAKAAVAVRRSDNNHDLQSAVLR
jgi:hypothetical protein